jgi:hypothetical protein
MAKKLFEYAVLYHPKITKEQRDAGEESQTVLVIPPTTVLAKDEKVAGLAAARLIPAEYETKLDNVEIIIRPF